MICLEKCVQDLLLSLTCQPHSPLQHLETKQALAKQFAEILHFTLKFDDLKVCFYFICLMVWEIDFMLNSLMYCLTEPICF